MKCSHIIPAVFLLLLAPLSALAEQSAPPDYNQQIAPLLRKYCTGCHSADEPEGGLVLESHEGLLKGGSRGVALVPGKSDQSRLWLVLEGRAEPSMPPEGSEAPGPEEIALVKAWIDAGAKGPTGEPPDPTVLITPQVELRAPPRLPITAAGYSPDGRWLAVASGTSVMWLDAQSQTPVRELAGHRGSVAALAFSADGSRLITAAGEPGLFGELRVWDTADGSLVRVITGHRDALYACAISPDGRLLASGSYDDEIKLWDAASGKELRTLAGHNGAVFGLAFRAGGKHLASASADRTVKIWDTASGERLETLSQSLKELYCLAFSPDGRRLAAGGVDNRVRVWEISPPAREGSNALLYSRFAHEGAVTQLAYSPDGQWLVSAAEDGTVKIWEAETMSERRLLERQSDWPSALAFTPDSRRFVIGRLDGSFSIYDAEGQPVAAAKLPLAANDPGPAEQSRLELPAEQLLALADPAEAPPADKPAPPPPKPELSAVAPRGLQRGAATRLELSGKNLAAVSELKFNAIDVEDPKLEGQATPKLTGRRLDPIDSDTRLVVEVTAAADLPLGVYELAVVTPGGSAGPVKLVVDDIPQIEEQEPNDRARLVPTSALPASFWGTIGRKGDVDSMAFEAQAGQTVVFDVSAAAVGSKLNSVLVLLGPEGEVLQSANDFDGQADSLLAFRIPADGRYTVRIEDLLLGASPEHYYKLSIGRFPYVTAVYPLGIAANQTTEVELVGYNLPPGTKVPVQAGGGGRVPVPTAGFRARREFSVVVGGLPEALEAEPNDTPQQAQPIAAPGTINGRTGGPGDVDLFRIEAQAGQTWIVETEAARLGSPIDTRIEVLDLQGQPVERLLLQAVRDSYITFRGIDSQTIDVRVTNWEEMELNQFLYMQGEVCKLFRMPQGPDSGFNFYGIGGKRRCYFDTSPTAHAVDEPCYIVEPHAPGAELVPNGLPVFPLYFANDDDGERKLGSDSRLTFTAPRDGAYLVRVSDVRDYGGDRFAYRLTLRPPQPDFHISVGGTNPTINAGSGKGISFTADRRDGFEGEITIDVEGLPPGFHVSSPIVIQSGHLEAKAVVYVDPDAPPPSADQAAATRLTARAEINGETVVKEIGGLGKLAIGERPQVTVHLEPAELTIAPGTTITARLRIERNNFNERVRFNVDNLPHGVIVDNIGLNGVLIPEGQSEREIFLTAAGWVPETSRPFHAVAIEGGNQASRPVLLHVRKPSPLAAGKPAASAP